MLKAVVFDLDGTVYVGHTPVPGAVEAIGKIRESGIKTLFLTNAAIRSRRGVADMLGQMGIAAQADEIYPSSYVVARFIAQRFPGKKVFMIGEKGLEEELVGAGLRISEDADVVAVSLDRHATYDKMARAHRLIRKGAAFVASNLDPAYPVEDGDLPGSGAVVAMLERSTGKKPIVAGKPETFVLEIMEKDHSLKAEEMLLVGDRLDTDIEFAKRCGMRSALVLSGSAKKGDENIKKVKPDLVLNTVATLPSDPLWHRWVSQG